MSAEAERDALAARLAAVERVLTEWGALDDGGFDSDFAEAIQESGAWRLSRDLRAALDGQA